VEYDELYLYLMVGVGFMSHSFVSPLLSGGDFIDREESWLLDCYLFCPKVYIHRVSTPCITNVAYLILYNLKKQELIIIIFDTIS